MDHGGDVVSRYAHLLTVAPGIQVGYEVAAGEVIGSVGNSGTPEGVRDPNSNIHLHFEVRIGETYLGEGLAYTEMLAELRRVFTGP